MTELTPGERRSLRARAHHLQPVVMIGDAGLTSAILQEIEVNLRSHELIKIKAQQHDRRARATLAAAISAALDAVTVQHIGKILVIYRPRPEDARRTAEAPQRRVHRKQPRRTKRSYQMG